MMISSVIENATEQLCVTSETPHLDAVVIFSHITGINKTYIISHPEEIISKEHIEIYQDAIKRRLAHEPVAYITEKKEFYGYDFVVNKSVLIPRPDTELIVEEVLKLVKKSEQPFRILDLGVGSGCIVCSILCECNKMDKKCEAVAIDISSDALKVAEINSRNLGVYEQIKFYQGDWVKPLSESDRFDIIVCNPPYIAEHDPNVSMATSFEPHYALYSDNDGLYDIRTILNVTPSFLKESGVLIFEFGEGQYDAIEELATKLHLKIEAVDDLSGRKRIAVCRF